MSGNSGASESISIEETNRIRISLGLKPLDISEEKPQKELSDASVKSSYVDQEQQAYENWKKQEQEEINRKKEEELKSKLEKLRQKNERRRRTQGKTLAETLAEEDDQIDANDTRAWILKMRNSSLNKNGNGLNFEAKNDAPRRSTLHSQNAGPNVNSSLEGMKIAHGFQDLNKNDGLVLTLKDADILDEDNHDLLENVEMVQRKTKNERKEDNPYKPYEDENDFLQQSEADQPSGDTFTTIGPQNSLTVNSTIEKHKSDNKKTFGTLVSFVEPTITGSEQSDYRQIKIKKSKKKKPKSDRRKRQVELDAENENENDPSDFVQPNGQSNSDLSVEQDSAIFKEQKKMKIQKRMRELETQSFADDDDLQQSIAMQRRLAQKRAKILKPEDVAEQLQNAEEVTDMADSDTASGLIFDDTRAFVNSIKETENREALGSINEQAFEDSKDLNDTNSITGSSPTDESNALVEDTSVDISATLEEANTQQENAEDEPLVSDNVGAVLSLLRNKGVIKVSDEAKEKIQKEEEYNKWFARKQKARVELEEQRRKKKEQDRLSGKFEKMTQKEREQYAKKENERWDKKIAEIELEQFHDYKPQVDIKYVDEFGVELGPKEAYKYLLSHQFHGKGSGKAKTEKRLRRIVEKEREERKPIF